MDRKSIYLMLVICCMVHCKPSELGFRETPGGLKARVNPSCTVKEESSGKIKGCIFPFQFQGKMYYGCTENGFKAGEEVYPWCSTKVDSVNNEVNGEGGGKHVTGGKFYGDCSKSDNCPMHKEAFQKLEILESVFFPNLDLSPNEDFGTGTRTTSLGSGPVSPIDKVSQLSEECKNAVDDYDEDYGEIKTVGQTLQNCILESQFNMDLSPVKSEDITCDGSCKCIPYQDCNWSKTMLEDLTLLANNNNNRESPVFKTGLKFFNDKVCDYNKKHVYCCNGNQHPSDEQVEKLKVMDPCVKPTLPTNVKDSGKWKPNGFKGECGTPTILNNILSGKIAKNGEFPYMTLISDNGQNKCGGSLINKRYILTAAHCVKDYEGSNKRNLEVALGDYILNEDPDCTRNSIARLCHPRKIVGKVNKVVIHENYDRTNNLFNNIALIRLEELVPLHTEDPIRSIVAPVCLPWFEDDYGRDLEENTGVLISGWGLVTNLEKRKEAERTLRKQPLTLADKEDCAGIKDNQICAARKRRSKDKCTGDSGGPLVSREYSDEPWYQVGILTVPQGRDCERGGPDIYTKVEDYLKWIEDHLDE